MYFYQFHALLFDTKFTVFLGIWCQLLFQIDENGWCKRSSAVHELLPFCTLLTAGLKFLFYIIQFFLYFYRNLADKNNPINTQFFYLMACLLTHPRASLISLKTLSSEINAYKLFSSKSFFNSSETPDKSTVVPLA